MTAKLWGSVLLLGGSGLLCLRRIRGLRQMQRTVWALALMLERMEGAIRWQQLPLPRVLERETLEHDSGIYAQKVAEYLKGGIPLQIAWEQAFFESPTKEMADILRRIDLSGDVTQITGALRLGAQQLRQLADHYAAARGQKERLCVATVLSLTGLAVILLI